MSVPLATREKFTLAAKDSFDPRSDRTISATANRWGVHGD